jgi:4-hydroxy-3-polyprenylbenzoate decarboxylase
VSRSRASDGVLHSFCDSLDRDHPLNRFPLITLVDDSSFASESLRNWLWLVFTRSDPAGDIDSPRAAFDDKHWVPGGPLVIDARIKPHHAPPLVENAEITRRVNALAVPNGPLYGIA